MASHQTMLSYETQLPIATLSYTSSSIHEHLLALGSFGVNAQNTMTLLSDSGHHSPSSTTLAGSSNLIKIAEISVPYPPTAIQFSPSSNSTSSLASTSDKLRVYQQNEDVYGANGEETWDVRAEMSHHSSSSSSSSGTKKKDGGQAPLTGLSWNTAEEGLIVSCSVDTTCTVWDVNTSTAITQLIAHDKEVYDVCWLPNSTDLFVSVGADGSLRAFDLRSLEHSTILYEHPSAPANNPSYGLARISFSPLQQNYLSTFSLPSSQIQILDMRSPGTPLLTLQSPSSSAISSITWGASGGLVSCQDDGLVLHWDLNNLDAIQPVALPHSNNSSTPGGSSGGASPIPPVVGANGSPQLPPMAVPVKTDPDYAFSVGGGVSGGVVEWHPSSGRGGGWVGSAGTSRDGKTGWVRSLRVA